MKDEVGNILKEAHLALWPTATVPRPGSCRGTKRILVKVPKLTAAIAKLGVQAAIIDGEFVIPDEKGRPSL